MKRCFSGQMVFIYNVIGFVQKIKPLGLKFGFWFGLYKLYVHVGDL